MIGYGIEIVISFFFSEKEFAAKAVNFSSSFFLKNLL